MSEKYSIVFRLSPNLYTENSPVIISSGALIKDEYENTISTLLKIKNISDKNIKACKISIKCFDPAGNIVLNNFEYQYLDLNAERDWEFGDKTPILLPDNSIRSFEVNISEIIFHDNSILTLENDAWESLSEPLKLDVWLEDPELEKQFLIEYGEHCKNKAVQVKDLWICACSNINKLSEIDCHSCGLAFNDIIDINTESLRLNCEERLQNEKKEHKRKIKKIFISSILTVIFIIVIVGATVISKKITTLNKYNKALEIASSENCIDAIKLFDELGDYKDSQAQINKIIFNNTEKLYDYMTSDANIENLEIVYSHDIDRCSIWDFNRDNIECLYGNLENIGGALCVGGDRDMELRIGLYGDKDFNLHDFELYKISERFIMFGYSYYDKYWILIKTN